VSSPSMVGWVMSEITGSGAKLRATIAGPLVLRLSGGNWYLVRHHRSRDARVTR
jgi:hypothetical protein